MIIYRFENLTNGKVYIGQTTRSLHECTTTGKSYKSIKEASEDIGILATNLSRVCRGGRKTAGGFQWKYI